MPGEPETVVIGLASDMATEPVLPEGVVLSQVTEPADIYRIAEMEAKVWGHDSSGLASDVIREMAAAPGDILVFAAEAAGMIVSAGRIEFRPGTEFAGLWGGATLREWRGKGIYRALVASRAQLAAARGVRYLQVDAFADSAPILQRLGFVAVTTTTPYVWSPQSWAGASRATAPGTRSQKAPTSRDSAVMGAAVASGGLKVGDRHPGVQRPATSTSTVRGLGSRTTRAHPRPPLVAERDRQLR